MKLVKNLASIFITALLFLSCEKVIEIPLDDADRKFVIEGILKDNPGDNVIKISKSGSVYEDSGFEKVSGATVIVTDASGTSYTFEEMSDVPGTYSNSLFTAALNDKYDLDISIGEVSFSATSSTFYKPLIDSLTYTEQIGTFGIGSDTTYLVFFSFFDDASAENYYRINAFINGKKESAYYITNDQLFNGQNYTQPLFASTIEKGDTVLVELLSMDKGNYNYFFSLAGATTEGPFAPSPANPVSNIESNALGYFGAYTSDTMTIVIPQ